MEGNNTAIELLEAHLISLNDKLVEFQEKAVQSKFSYESLQDYLETIKEIDDSEAKNKVEGKMREYLDINKKANIEVEKLKIKIEADNDMLSILSRD